MRGEIAKSDEKLTHLAMRCLEHADELLEYYRRLELHVVNMAERLKRYGFGRVSLHPMASCSSASL
jgi:hypothetical protein